MTEQETAVAVAQMHAVALTVAEILAVGTNTATHPLALAIGCIAVLPNIHEIVLVDVALMIVGTDAGTGCNGAVGHDGTHGDACLSGEETVTHLALIVAQKALTTIVGTDAPFLTGSFDELEESAELVV